MPKLTIGRVGFDFDLDNPNQIRTRVDGRRTRVDIRGELRSSSLANTKALKSELEEYAAIDQVVAVTMNDDSLIDAYYFVDSVDMDAQDYALNESGLFDFDIRLTRAGNHATVEFLSNYTGLLVVNDHGLTEGEVQFFHAPPVAGDDAYTAGGGTSATERTTEDGAIPVFLDVPLTDKLGTARWGCAPANFYKGAARVDVNGYTRSGLYAPMTPASFVIGNGLIELRAEASGGVTIGDVAIRAYNGSWGSWTPFDIVWNSTTDIPEWQFFNIIRNDPECVIVKLTRDADEAPPTDNRHELTFTLRRGAPFVSCHFVYSNNVALTIDRATTDAGTSVTPTGASSAMAVRDSANDGDGNRWVVGAPKTITADTTNGGIDLASAAEHGFLLGFEIGGSGADTDNNADAICRQYLAQLNETVSTVLR